MSGLEELTTQSKAVGTPTVKTLPRNDGNIKSHYYPGKPIINPIDKPWLRPVPHSHPCPGPWDKPCPGPNPEWGHHMYDYIPTYPDGVF